MSEPEAFNKARLPIVAFILRLVTMILLLTSLTVLITDSATFKPVLSSKEVTIRMKYILLLQVINYKLINISLLNIYISTSTGKHLVGYGGLIYFNLFSDKVVLSLLASGVGAGFGATYDLKKNLDNLDDILQKLGYKTIADIQSELDDFFNLGYVSATLLLLGFLYFGVSSFISSLALSRRTQN
ncbi:CASP-like protein 4D1 [Hevea brasiliensis]|uniref:CASP-like protein 4D1 n=1 Tax=Hevea brasiliensis TaxID=3981 RepID=UPI0025FCC094|nr:CASP-like protein 4D1 [Hevea brasiliensis]